MTRYFSVASLVVAASLASACIVRGGDAHPLYVGEERPRAETARLVGPIGTVDGQDVSKLGKAFSLLPGCHVAKLAAKTGQINSLGGSGGYVASLPPSIYPFRMQAGHTYEIQVVLDSSSGPIGQMTIRAWDRDANGGSIEVSPAATSADIDDCLKWHPGGA